MQYCSLQHRTLLLSPVIPTTGCCFCFGSILSFSLELFLCWSPGVYWAPTDLGSSSSSILSFSLFILFMGFSRQEYWSGFPFPSPVDHILSDLSTVTRLSWVAPHAWLSFTELDTAVVLWSDWLVFYDCGFCLSALWCPLSAYCLPGLSLTLDMGYLFGTWGYSGISPAKCSCCSLPWTRALISFRTLWDFHGASLMAQRLQRLPAMRETWVRSLGWEDPLEKEMATHSSIPAWRIPRMEEPGGLPSTGLQRVGHDCPI